jgi:succinate-semialdehyde dehydrogenase/glutarate-semialdehyde dehydrogenase
MKAAKWVNLRMKHRIMVRWQGVDELHEQVLKTVAGGSLSLEDIFDQNGAYYPATILADLQPGMEGFDNELFGPVACDSAKDDNEAIALANNQFGLGSGVLTADKLREKNKQLEAGSSFVNKLVVSDPRLPLEGIKNSGYGRELAAYGIREFVNTKTIWID